tara:strand:+ start:44 stop:2293 length:2250 start_codon:yes stop_codon:yes gene_type:complete
MNILTQKFVDVVFDKGDYTCMGPHYQNKTFPVSTLLHETEEYVSINAMRRGTTRKITNVTKLRTFLFEMDEDINGNPIAMKEQIALIMKSGLPWSTMTTSASKSVHFLLVLNESLEDRPIYTAYFQAIRAALLLRGIKCDQACKDPSRFTRAPFGINTKKDLVEKGKTEEQRTQKCLRVNQRHDRHTVDQWLESQGVKVDDYLKIPTNKPVTDGQTSSADVDWKFDVISKNFMRDDVCVQGNINNYQHKMAWFLFGTGCTKGDIQAVFAKKFDKIDHRDPITSAEKSSTKCDPIYISTPEEQKAYYKNQDQERNHELLRGSYDRELPPEVKEILEEENINLYETIGTEYYKVNPVDRRLIPWSKTMFEKLYGSNMIPPRAYNLKGYQPDYLSDKFPTDLALDQKTRNVFMRPTWKQRDGDWSTIREGLKHGFGDQYHLALQYCAILIAFPKAKLPLIWFLGTEDKGKSAVVAIFKHLVGLNNTKKVNNAQLESDFDSFLGESQLVVVEEAGSWKEPKMVTDKLKDWVTETMEVTVNPKYGKQYDTPIHAKFMFTSNNWESVPATGQATRFWVIDIKQEPTNRVADYYGRVESEMGAFVNYLTQDIVPTIKRNRHGDIDTSNRLYFEPSEYMTDAKRFVKSINKGPIHDAISEKLSEFFEKFPKEDVVYFDAKAMKEANKWQYKESPGSKAIKIYMKQEWDLQPTNQIVRPDSLRWIGDADGLKPTRASYWYSLTRDQIIPSDAIFNLSN